jgi:NAD(P)-dependent dehydrogenase (short-subunit alcohol dehydrogenase family)
MKTALVTGAGSGIGRAVALALSAHGYRVALTGRRVAQLNETAELAAGPCLVHAADLGCHDEVVALFAVLRRDFTRLDLLFNNAGRNVPAIPMDEITPQDWQDIVAINLSGAFYCAQQAMRLMKEQTPQGGRIINNGSISAQTPRPHSAPYTATKHAITGLTKSIALDGRPFRIACGQIDIGNAATDMTQRMQTGVLQANGTMAEEPRMDVQHVADAVLYMAGLPLESNVLQMTVMATNMPLVGRG